MANPTFTQPRFSSTEFLGLAWGGTAISLGFVIFRAFVRVVTFRRLFADDFLVFAAWLMLLASTIIWQTQYPAMYTQYELSKATIEPTPQVLAAEKTLLRAEVAVFWLFYSCLWSVKLSFLLFFRRLGENVRRIGVWWWCVLGFTVVTWITCVGDIPYWCLLGSVEYTFTQCPTLHQVSYQWTTLHYNCAVDILSDASIISIAVVLLWNVRISMRKKLALLGIFSLTIIDIIISIVRVTEIISKRTQVDLAGLQMWGEIEMTVAVIVACLGSFRQLFVRSSQSGYLKQSERSSTMHRYKIAHIFEWPRRKASRLSQSLSFWRAGSRKSEESLRSSRQATDQEEPRNTIQTYDQFEAKVTALREPKQTSAAHIDTSDTSTVPRSNDSLRPWPEVKEIDDELPLHHMGQV
ncbi:hypothetical protein EV356DRAFT_580858 [Viridothelium virens]|uniref:Rhodopsin domain-containing protein n=1 Tax=Viridothelium virens TaxID=1048519 RepID=A0A6A6GUA5_VIRVR|nr:hypothetical protein EV356DRAFT_580858 [Viridothelium virens]